MLLRGLFCLFICLSSAETPCQNTLSCAKSPDVVDCQTFGGEDWSNGTVLPSFEVFDSLLFDKDCWSNDFDFILYLLGRRDWQECLFLLDQVSLSSVDVADSVNYLRGWILYNKKELLMSANHLLQVSAASPVYKKSLFFGAYNLAHSGLVAESMNVLDAVEFEHDSMHEAMRNFQLSGLSLLERQYDRFDHHAASFTGGFHAMAREEGQMKLYSQTLIGMPVRSPVVAGLMSAAVPGLGKVYAGKTAEGIAAFFYSLTFGATAYDFYRNSGPRSFLFIASASVAGAFYLGNIWGSVVAVDRHKRELYHEIDQRILFDLHIPLRNAYN